MIPGAGRALGNPNDEPPPAYLCLKLSKIPALTGKNYPQSRLAGNQPPCTAQNGLEIPFRLK